MATHRRHSEWRRVLLATGVPIGALVLLTTAWVVDTAAQGDGVVRNVTLAGEALGGRNEAEVYEVVSAVARRYQDAEVHIVTGDSTYEATAADLGLHLDQAATATAALDLGRDGSVAMRPLSWLRSFVSDWRVPLRFTVDAAILGPALVALEGNDRVPPVEPQFEPGPGGLSVVAGRPGKGLDPGGVGPALLEAAGRGDIPIVVQAEPADLVPRFSDDEARALADQATALTTANLEVRLGDAAAVYSPDEVRTWLRTVAGDSLTLGIDRDAVLAALRASFPDVTEPLDARFDVVDGEPVVIASVDGTSCCALDTADRVLAAVEAVSGIVEVAPSVEPAGFTTEQAQALGIVEEIGDPDAFGPTTKHAAGEPRVTNIHRIADIIRGVIIRPGETFSVNGYVGERTVENGFVDAPVIYNGEFTHDVGGGVSQFATTMFNAALYAGLDFGEYQSHSIEISRYPKGHEATISYPHPDLEIVNETPFGVLVWPTYTGSSITVHLYSTRYAEVALGQPQSSPQGNCTRWTTSRTRTFPDGTTKTDSVFAVYRPGEGIAC